jgi:RNA polymerase sigma factor (sigma-70 family)
MASVGFEFRYCTGGQPPTVALLSCDELLKAGDLASYEGDHVTAAGSEDEKLVGVVLDIDPGRAAAAKASVVTDADAVYAVADRGARVAGASLGLNGGRGTHGVRLSDDGPLEVVVDCVEGEVTLVRIKLDRHHEVVIAPDLGLNRPNVTPERERALVIAAAVGDPKASAALVEAFLPAISAVARLYRHTPGVEHAELVQEGVVGLLRALKRFDPTLGTPFWAYSSWWVRQAMQQLVAEVTRPIVLSDRALRSLARIREARRSFLQENGREPSVDEIAAAAGLARHQAYNLLAIERTPRGLEEAAGSPDSSATLADLIVDPDAEGEYAGVLARLEIEQVRDLTEGLAERERRILCEHYGLDRPARTLREIGDELGLSAERVRQIEEQALGRLRAAVSTPQSAA